jgi:hypothetical protein
MSNSLNIAGILAGLLNTDTQALTPNPSAKNAEPSSLSAALNRRQTQAHSVPLPSENPTKKAIVLQAVSGTPASPTPEANTNWLTGIESFLSGFGATPQQVAAISNTFVTNYPEYYVWVLPNSRENIGTIPRFDATSTILNPEQFIKCVVSDTALVDNLIQGSLVRIDYENRRLRSGAYVVSVLNNDEVFASAIVKELVGISAENGFGACNDMGVSANHASGDVIGAGADLLPPSAITPFGLRHGNKNEPTNWTGIEIHYTVTQNAADAISVLGNRGLSYHYLIDKDGTRTMLIDPDYIAWHGGDDNSRFIGISLVNLGNDIASINLPDATPAEEWVKLASGQYGTWEPYTAAQESTLVALVSELKAKYPTVTYINGHEDNSAQKYDPGPLFNWNLPFGLTRGPEAASTKNRS